ncbi:envelope glycoprotein B [Common bottlenose dolphin gammaherpesvirus 1 strain Sarasota]|uniref:Envelope glycoprotein B n=1 Tax=Common bottlenose dolphin gammaherpesvirus 1 strain Sarasota TaxID=2022783 RepID=A0A1Z1NEE1_9GAMA|nr:envelope glycoprotein B [Common bottlenose dolphin gammaherpesvirus 1 strain Sarasota]ARW78075.1 envelope glycoprotein B [Common bottlenose dolphin gammaherpesvirus 1 strain Sarasota]
MALWLLILAALCMAPLTRPASPIYGEASGQFGDDDLSYAPPDTHVRTPDGRIVGATENTKMPFRICSASASGDIFRFPTEHRCPDTRDLHHDAGIMLIYKANIVPYIFNVRKYRKIVTTSTVYNGVYEDAITNQYTMKFSVPKYELDLIDSSYQCHSAVSAGHEGNLLVYTDRDDVNQTVPLKPIGGLLKNIVRYATQTKIYADPGCCWGMYKRRTTVNCEVTDMTARASPPFHFFVTSAGDTLEMSPFWGSGAEGAEWNQEPVNSTWVKANHTMRDYDKLHGAPSFEPRVFANKAEFTLSWRLANRTQPYCPLVSWKSFHNGIRTRHGSKYHFVANEVTASFTVPDEQISDFEQRYACLSDEINKTIDAQFDKVSPTYFKNGTVEYYKTAGGLFIVWQPLASLQLKEAEEALISATSPTTTPPSSTGTLSRRRRSVDSDGDVTPSPTPGDGSRLKNGLPEDVAETVDNVVTAQVQFAYDKLRISINSILEELSRAWCREQNRAAMMWSELSKINPTTVMTAIYGHPVSAKRVGDAISVSHCVNVDQSSVSLHRTMHIDDDLYNCYARPLVTFRFVNDTATSVGQLGVANEILLTNTFTEPCQDGAEHYIQAGNTMYVYKDYMHVKSINVTDVATLDTFIMLNISLLENIDFEVIELYSKQEKKLSNVFDLESIFRDYNYYTQRLYGLRRDLDNSVRYNRNEFVEALGDLASSLGVVGSVLVNAVSGTMSLLGTIVSGFIDFFKNPFGGFLILLLIGGVILVIFLVSNRTKLITQQPIKLLYPGIEDLRNRHKTSEVQPISDAELERIIMAMDNYRQRAALGKKTGAQQKPTLTSLDNGSDSSVAEESPAENSYVRNRFANAKMPIVLPRFFSHQNKSRSFYSQVPMNDI